MITLGVICPDWHPGVSRHIVNRGIHGFIQGLAQASTELQVARIGPGVLGYSAMNDYDAILTFHHCTTGFYMYENPIYCEMVKQWNKYIEEYKGAKLLWHVEPKPTFNSISGQQVKHSDVILTSSALSMFDDKTTIYIPNGVKVETLDEANKSRFYSAPMNLSTYLVDGREDASKPGHRLDILKRHLFNNRLDIYGDGWEPWKSQLGSAWELHDSVVGDQPFRQYRYVCEAVEATRLDELNSIGYCSDRVGLALAYGCHLVTNLKWMSKVYESVVQWEDLEKHSYDSAAIRRDVKKFSWSNLARVRAPAIHPRDQEDQ